MRLGGLGDSIKKNEVRRIDALLEFGSEKGGLGIYCCD